MTLYLEQKFATCLLAKLVPLLEMMAVKPEVTNYVPPMKLHYLLSRDLGEQHRLYLLSEIVNGYQEGPELGKSS